MRLNALILIFLGLLAAKMFGDSPEFVGGSILRDRGSAANIPQIFTSAILFRSDGSYSVLWARRYNILTPGLPADYVTPVDGSYTYQKTGQFTATLMLSNGNGVQSAAQPDGPATFLLNFSPQSSGNNTYQNNAGYSAVFSLIPAANGATLPLVNVSTRVVARQGSPAIVGFIVNGPADVSFGNPGTIGFGINSAGAASLGNQEVLIRVVGPGLAPLGVPGYWPKPSFKLYQAFNQGASAQIVFPSAQATGWSATPAGTLTQQRSWNITGAFPLAAGSADLSEVLSLAPGPYTIVVEPATTADGGDVLVEVYVFH